MTNTEIYFDDLNEEKQEDILETAGIETAEEMNLDVFPLVVTNLPTEQQV